VTVPVPAEGPLDAQLIAEWRSGDEGAAAELVRRHTPALARFLAAAGAREDLDDLVQETFFRAFRRIETFRGTAKFATWLMAIASNALKDLRRRAKGRTVLTLEERDLPDETADPHGEVVGRDLMDRLERAVQGLPPMQRDVFLMRAQQGAEYKEIAEALETSVGAARVHYHQAVKRLKATLEK
jgi:RNA polymerase sigma-70 factor (ECF subfamily)